MTRMDSHDALSAAKTSKLRRKQRWIGLMVVIGLIGALIAARGLSQVRSNEGALQSGALALKAALLGDRERFEEAERQFARASTGLVVDAYPVFCMELTRGLKTGDVTLKQQDLVPVANALLRADFKAAKEAIDSAQDGKGKTWLSRLIRAMEMPSGT